MAESKGQLELCRVDGLPQVQVALYDETVWMSQAQMAELFQRDVRTISEHINNIYDEGELEKDSTIRNFRTVRNEGDRQVTRNVTFYNLDLIISLGYRVNSKIGTKFRQWATNRLREYLTKGFVLNEQKLMEGEGKRFDDLLARIRSIRTSEKSFYLKVTDIFATSTDYDAKSEMAHEFFAVIQNQFHYATHGHTAAEIIVQRADASKPYMGLTSWKGDRISLDDARVAKNYLNEDEMKRLELLVEQFLSFAELRSLEGKPMRMLDWVVQLREFFNFNDKPILEGAGKVSRKAMETKVKDEFMILNRAINAKNSRPSKTAPLKAAREQKQLRGYTNTRKKST
jgi:hypothetical protein